LAQAGRYEDALRLSEETLIINRDFASERPQGRADLSLCLSNTAGYLFDLDRLTESLRLSEEALAIRRVLADERPDKYLEHLAVSLRNTAAPLGKLGRYEEAMQLSEEDVVITRALFAQRPDAYRGEIADSTADNSVRFASLGRYRSAIAAAEEAVSISTVLANKYPDSHSLTLARSLHIHSSSLMNVGRYDEASNASRLALTAVTSVRSDARMVLRDRLDVEAGLLLHLSLAGRLDEALIQMGNGDETLQNLIAGSHVVGLLEAASRYDLARAQVNLRLKRVTEARQCALAAAGRADLVLLKGHRSFAVEAAMSWATVADADAFENLPQEATSSAERALQLLAEDLENRPRILPRGVAEICGHLVTDDWRVGFPNVCAALEIVADRE
jgi:tetratricopeptide (TPR) repeat protein